MNCPDCGTETVVFDVPGDLREHAPDGADRVAVCTRCLRLTPTDEPTGGDFSDVSTALPADDAAAAAVVLAVGQLGSLALNRERIAVLLAEAEERGADVFLVLDRLRSQGSLDPHFDADRRLAQLEQML